MRTNDFFDDRKLDLKSLWKALGVKPPGRIIDPPAERQSQSESEPKAAAA